MTAENPAATPPPAQENNPTHLKIAYVLIALLTVTTVGFAVSTIIRKSWRRPDYAVQKSMQNDARQISAAVNQYCYENNCTQVSLDKVIGPQNFIASLSSGVRVRGGPAVTNFTKTELDTPTNLAGVTLSIAPGSPNAYFSLAHARYNSDDVHNELKSGGPLGYDANNFILFSVETGYLVAKNIKPPAPAAPAARP